MDKWISSKRPEGQDDLPPLAPNEEEYIKGRVIWVSCLSSVSRLEGWPLRRGCCRYEAWRSPQTCRWGKRREDELGSERP